MKSEDKKANIPMKQLSLTVAVISFIFCNQIFGQRFDYVPTKGSVPNISIDKARLELEDALKKWCDIDFISVYSSKQVKLFSVSRIKDNKVVLEFQNEKNQDTIKYTIDFSDFEIPHVVYNKYTSLVYIKLQKGLVIRGSAVSDHVADEYKLLGKQLVDALFILKNRDQKLEQELEQAQQQKIIADSLAFKKFKTQVEEYKTLKIKPQLSEEAREYIVQATALTEDKKYADAIELYDKAIAIDQTYPQAHFNKALLQGQVERYEEAIAEMKKYLMLVPDATDARAAQDKIYVWKGKLKK